MPLLIRTLCACGILWLGLTPPAAAQAVCPGDVDGDGVRTVADVEPLLQVLFDPEGFDAFTFDTADVNVDRELSAADVVLTVALDGVPCPSNPDTRTPTRTPTRTATRTIPGAFTPTPTRTPTRGPTTAPTAACVPQAVGIGSTSGSLAQGDCEIIVNGQLRLADEYRLTVAPDQEIGIAVTATGFSPVVRLVDGNGYFSSLTSEPPASFRAAGTLPYTILVTSKDGTPAETGSYTLTITSRPCETSPLRTQVGSFDGSECSDPGVPGVGDSIEYADVFTFEVTQPLTLISITMRQSLEASLIDPMLAVYGPGGFEVFPSFQADDQAIGGFGFDAAARFTALDTGTYTVVATGGGCEPDDEFGCGYRILFSSTSCAATAVEDIPSTVRQSFAGIHWGDPLRTRCGAPLPLAGDDEEGIPEIGSPADIYTFSGLAGDVITIEMEAEDEPQLYLLGPASVGNPLIAADGDSSGDLLAQIGVTLPRAGTYTVVAANKNFLFPPDPEDPEDEGEFAEYTLFLQQCPVRGAVSTVPGTQRNDSFSTIDCVGPGGVPVRSYALSLAAGTYVDLTMAAPAFDAQLTLVAPDGDRRRNDDDPLIQGATDARLGLVAPTTGTYFLEASMPLDADFEPGALGFTVAARSCLTRAVAPGLIDGELTGEDCALSDGRRYDVLTFDAPVDAAQSPVIAGLGPGPTVCAWSVPVYGAPSLPLACGPEALEIPLAATGRYAWIVVGREPTTRGAYRLDYVRCPAALVELGDAVSGNLNGGDCVDATGDVAEWFALRERADLIRFDRGASLEFRTSFDARFSVAGADGTSPVNRRFVVDTESFFDLGDDLLVVPKLRGQSVQSQGSFDLEVDFPDRRQ